MKDTESIRQEKEESESNSVQKIKEERLEKRKTRKKFFVNLFDIRGDMMSYEEIDLMMEENTNIHGSNMWILMMAILIASIGLNVNSTAVIIGAMLISPLMSAILTMGYSLAVRDLKMLRQALLRFGVQVLISLITSGIYFRLSPLDTPTSEMIARTNPTIWDVLIALFGGIAGIIGNTRQKKSNVIPGVAIATALMPPLCTAGYGIATMQWRFILGAFYLFCINTLFIALSAAFVTVILGVPVHQTLDRQKQKRINRMVATITVITVVPSILIGAYTVYNTYVEHNVSDYLKTEFVFNGTQLVQSSFNQSDKIISVSLVGMPISEDAIALLERELKNYDLEDYHLVVTQNMALTGEETDNTDKITIAIQENTIGELQAKIEEQENQLEVQRTRLDEIAAEEEEQIDYGTLAQKAESIFEDLSDCRCGVISDENEDIVILAAETDRSYTAQEREILENWLKSECNVETVRVFLQYSEEETVD